jgi:uncharacterized cupin superfamily protein
MEAGNAKPGEVLRVGPLEIRYLLEGSAATGGLGSFEMTVPPQAAVPAPHSHTANDEWLYVLEGVLRYRVDEDIRDLKPGESMFAPRGKVHHFSNPHAARARVLIVQTPDIGPQYYRDVGAVVNGGGPPDRARIFEVMTRYGLKPVPPPPAG